MSVAGLLPVLSEHEAYRLLVQCLKTWQRGGRWLLPGLPEAAEPLLLAALQRDLGAPILALVPRAEDAKRLHDQILLWSQIPAGILLYPEPDSLPYERVPGGDPTARQRVSVLAALSGLVPGGDAQPLLVVASARALMHQTMAMRDLAAHSRVLRRGQRVPPAPLLEACLRIGYEPVTLVEEPGQMSRRGGIVDVFPLTSPDPVRIEFFGDEIASLRLFDPTTQRSRSEIQAVTITPPTEVLPEHSHEAAAALARMDMSGLTPAAREQLEADRARLDQNPVGHAARELWQFYGPLFYASRQPTTILDHFDGVVAMLEPPELAATGQDIEAEVAELKGEKVRRGELSPDFPPPLVSWGAVEEVLASRPCLLVSRASEASLLSTSRHAQCQALPSLPFAPAPLYGGRLKETLDDCQRLVGDGQRVVITSHQARRLSALLRERDLLAVPTESIRELPPPASLTLLQGSLAEGWALLDGRDAGGMRAIPTTLLTDVELFGWAKPRRAAPRRRAPADVFVSDLAPGDYVVHIEHGVAIFRGLVKLAVDGAEHEYLHLEYAEGDKLYVPTDHLDRVSRYVGVGEAAPTLTRLSSTEWDHIKERVRKAVANVAKDLLALYAARQVTPGHSFSPDTAWQGELEASFPYIETPDQLEAIAATKADMERPQPMDRLICGDVGYGKTEVALRAAFKAVMDDKQVAMLVPTTILAQQHYNTFRERLAPFPVRVEMLSRFRSEREQRQVLEGLQTGTVDICIGTHRLIQKDVVFRNLGLVIIDEEQRFGVMHKEKLKRLRHEVDVLTLTATPIPRTLHMSLVGVRDMSTIDTPPEERLPITTWVAAYDEDIIRQAILRELDRGGQVFFVHNRVQSIARVAQRLQKLLPDVSFAVGHGQMPEEQLERVMLDFAAGKTDVLVCTAIIESGLDIPNANTIIVNRADQFGLAQLYQLRGRVGRGTNRAYAYFLHDRSFQLTETAQQRLKAIFEATELGAGFRIAMKDLEIRGAGNILGVEQHGHISAVGFDLYSRLLAQEVERLQAQQPEAPPPASDLIPRRTSVSLPLDAYLPTSYIDDQATRLALYQRMATLDDSQSVQDMEKELTDRFGKPGQSVLNLLYMLDIRIRAQGAGVQDVSSRDHEIVIRLRDALGPNSAPLLRRFGPALKMGSYSLRLDRRKLGARWRDELRSLLDVLAEGQAPTHPAPRQ